VSNRDQADWHIPILRQKVQALLKELEELQEFQSRMQEAKALVALATRVDNSVPDSKVRH
jgi:hypothetical protein